MLKFYKCATTGQYEMWNDSSFDYAKYKQQKYRKDCHECKQKIKKNEVTI